MKTLSPQLRKYQRINSLCLIGYILILEAERRYHPTGTMAVLAAVSFSLCFMGLILTAALMLAKKRDEFQRNLLNQALLWGTGITMTITMVWGCLQEFANARPLPAIAIFPVFLIITAFAKVVLFRLNRAGNE